jgi:glycerol-3-phosphate O-acyltransferase/dihydroxyacetone phosphate acyltransferase
LTLYAYLHLGISYSQAHRFRSRVGIEFGEPITISKDMVENFKAGGKAKRRSCSTLLDSIQEGLKSITINVDTYKTLKVLLRLYMYNLISVV